MKKTSIVLLLVLALALIGIMVSCKNEISAPADELVSVSFEEAGVSRSLTATLEAFDKDNYYWKYAADKADDSGLTSGETATYDEAGALPVSNGNKGLRSVSDDKPYKVPGFSQGLWNFKLYAYRSKNADTGAYEELVYQGEAKNVSLTKGGANMALVTVSPATEGKGYIKIGTITFVPKKSGDKAAQLKFISVTNPDGSAVEGISYDASTATYTVPTGAYKVTVKFANAAQTVVYGEGYVIATVYPNLTTTIGGDLSELVTYAQFDAEQNPDAVNVQAASGEITYDTEEDEPVTITSSSSAVKSLSAEVARDDANAIIAAMAAEQAVGTDPATTSLKLTLSVDPTEATATSVTYEIGMKATLTYKKSTSDIQTSEKEVSELDNYVTVEIEMSSGLSNVNVLHDGEPMYPSASKADLDAATADVEGYSGFFFYDGEGKLYIKTKSFSPFAISYDAPANYVAMVGEAKYSTLAAAVQKVAADGTVKLIADVALPETLAVEKTFTLDLNGFDITAAGFRAIWVKEGTLTLSGKGIITANGEALKSTSSAIRVGDDAGTSAGLVIGYAVTVTSDRAYGVTVFGKDADGQTLVVYGKIKVTGTASAISGNGTSTLTATTIEIKKGAEIYSENDYAIYHPERGTLTVADEAIISGKGGIEVKGGEVVINGGAITATAFETTHVKNNDGTSTSGYALVAVQNNGYVGPAAITVNGGTISGVIDVIEDDEQASYEASLTVIGGIFSKNPEEFVASGSECVLEDDGFYHVGPKGQTIDVDSDDWETALATAEEFDTLAFADGEYGTIVIDSEIADNLTFDFSDVDTPFKINVTANADFEGLTIKEAPLAGTISSSGGSVEIRGTNPVSINFQDCTFNPGSGSWAGLRSWNTNASLVFSGCEFDATGSKYAVYNSTGPMPVVEFYGCTFSNFKKKICLLNSSDERALSIVFDGCTIDNSAIAESKCDGIIKMMGALAEGSTFVFTNNELIDFTVVNPTYGAKDSYFNGGSSGNQAFDASNATVEISDNILNGDAWDVTQIIIMPQEVSEVE